MWCKMTPVFIMTGVAEIFMSLPALFIFCLKCNLWRAENFFRFHGDE